MAAGTAAGGLSRGNRRPGFAGCYFHRRSAASAARTEPESEIAAWIAA